MKNKKIIWLLLLVIVLIGGIWWSVKIFAPEPIDRMIEIKIGNYSLQANIANTPASRERGLSGRSTLPADTGLLFIFDQPGFYNFWMKDMNFPIDIIWLDTKNQIIDITENLTPETYPQTVTSKQPSSFALEVPAGFAQNHNLKIGEEISW